MKAKSFVKFFVLFLALASLSACGGKNKKGETPAGVNLGGPGYSTNTAANSADYGTFVNQVAAGNFQSPSNANSIAQWKKYSNVSDLLNYGGDSNFNFDWCWGSDCFDQWDATTGARRIGTNQEIYRNNTFAFDAELGNNLNELLVNLVNRMRNPTNVKKCVQSGWGYDCRSENEINFYYGNVSTTRWYFEYGNRAYIIDTKFPLAANPVAVLKKDTNEGFALQ